MEILNDNNFEEYVNKNNLVVIDFFATWCGPCQIMSPLIDELAEENLPNVKVGKLDVDEAQENNGNMIILPSPAVQEVFDILGLVEIFSFAKTIEEAEKALS